jgi:hypothetical protein
MRHSASPGPGTLIRATSKAPDGRTASAEACLGWQQARQTAAYHWPGTGPSGRSGKARPAAGPTGPAAGPTGYQGLKATETGGNHPRKGDDAPSPLAHDLAQAAGRSWRLPGESGTGGQDDIGNNRAIQHGHRGEPAPGPTAGPLRHRTRPGRLRSTPRCAFRLLHPARQRREHAQSGEDQDRTAPIARPAETAVRSAPGGEVRYLTPETLRWCRWWALRLGRRDSGGASVLASGESGGLGSVWVSRLVAEDHWRCRGGGGRYGQS